MRKLVKYAVVVGVAGAAAGAAQSFWKEEPTDQIAQAALKGAGEAAALGAVVGFVADRRVRRKAVKRKAKLGSALSTGGFLEAARAARPAIEHAIDLMGDAAERARPRVEHAVEVARPKVEKAAKKARMRAIELTEEARPRVEHAVEIARPRVEQAAKVARDRAIDLTEQAREQVMSRVA